jgi:hypothetical protein
MEQPADFVSQITCTGSIGPSDPVAIVQLHADPYTGELALRDYADTTQPRTACTIGAANSRVEQLIDSRHLVIAWGSDAYAVVDLPEVRYHWFQLPPYTSESYSTFIAISPRLDEIVWLKERPGTEAAPMIGSSREIHITTSKGDRVVASLPDTLTGFCGAPPDYSKRGAFSLSGAHLFVLDHPRVEGGNATAMHSLRVFEGEMAELSLVPPSGGWPEDEHPAQAVWSPTSDTLYYRQGGDVWQWTSARGASVFLPGVNWYYPTLTPDGSHIAYVLVGDGQYTVYLIDLTTGAGPQLIGQAREKPVFLNDAQLWFTIPSAAGCVTGGGEPLIYSIIDRSESPSIIDRVLQVWPATSAWY